MALLYSGLAILALIAVLSLCFYVYGLVYRWWLSAKHPDYDRQLSRQETQFISISEEALTEFATTYPFRKKRNKTIYFLGLLPAMFFSWGLLLFLYYIALRSFESSLKDKLLSGEILYFEKGAIGFSHVLGVFAGILLAGYLLYWVTGFSRDFTSWMGVNGSSTNRESPEEVLQRRLNGIEHDVRLKRLSVHSTFRPGDYLVSIIERHKKITGWITLALVAVTLFFLFLDLRQQVVFHADKLSYTTYWRGHIIDMPYEELSEVQVSCYMGSKDSTHVKIKYVGRAGRFYQLENWRRDLERISMIDDKLREQNVSFVATILNPPNQPTKSGLQSRCVKKILKNCSAEERMLKRKIMHLDELL